MNSIEVLHQDDYRGKRAWINIQDKTRSVRFKLDIGVHTLLAIDQPLCCFSFRPNQELMLRVNPPEQIVAEKLYSFAKHGPLSTRFKDIYDIYYFISEGKMDRKVLRTCVDLLVGNNLHGLSSIEDICDIINTAFEDKDFVQQFEKSTDKWLDVGREVVFKTIIDYIYSI